jgi:hypothetical protein
VKVRNNGEERNKYTLHLRLHQLLHFGAGPFVRNQGRSAETPRENPPRSKKFGNIPERTKVMPLIKKAPAIVPLEVKVDEPVKQLLEDYARFIESSPDHVVNSVIKRNLWRDQDYRKWREQRRAQSLDSPKSAASPRG